MHIPSEIWDLLQTCPEPVTAFVAKLLSDKEQLEQENARLRAQINQNSSNSRASPSKNIFKKNDLCPTKNRQEAGRTTRAQRVHPAPVGKTKCYH